MDFIIPKIQSMFLTNKINNSYPYFFGGEPFRNNVSLLKKRCSYRFSAEYLCHLCLKELKGNAFIFLLENVDCFQQQHGNMGYETKIHM